MLSGLLRRLGRIETRWEETCSGCASLPRTLVHGDFSRKNSRVRATLDGPELVVMDWETAGWGSPAADLANWSRPSRSSPNGWRGTVALDAYATAVADAWPRVTPDDLEHQARIGTLFRLVAAIRWASEALRAGNTFGSVEKLATMDGALAAVDDLWRGSAHEDEAHE
jgi:aminoglycoside phosphotransferase (APT) family kinase protein